MSLVTRRIKPDDDEQEDALRQLESEVDEVIRCAQVVGAYLGRRLIELVAGRQATDTSEPGLSIVSLQRATKLLDIGESTLRQYVREGRIKSIRLDNGRLRFEKAELLRFQRARMEAKQ